jgi:hypothetical protein
MTFRMRPWAFVSVTLGIAACGSNGGTTPSYSLPVGSDDGGGGMFGGVDAGPSAALDAYIEQGGIAVTIVTVSCADGCANVMAVATGGHPPYTYAWDDGSTSPARTVCPTSNASYHVTVTDTAETGELSTARTTVEVPLTAKVLACPDGGAAGEGGLAVTVPSTADVWLAGQPSGSMLEDSADPLGADVVPTNSPVEVPVVAGSALTFAVTGMTSNASTICYPPSPDGGGCLADITMGPVNGLGSLECPGNALIGVFLDASVPSGTGPAGLDLSAASDGFAMLSPLLRQVFFIGDGLTGTGSGAAQRFVVPAGATRLLLGDSDGVGGDFDNSGQFTVVVSTL